MNDHIEDISDGFFLLFPAKSYKKDMFYINANSDLKYVHKKIKLCEYKYSLYTM